MAEFGPEKEEFVMLSSEKTSVDERDMFTKADVKALRGACDHPRNRALLEMLIYCGQRINALLTLRIKDIPKTEDGSLEGVFYLNPDSGGL